MDVGRYLVEAHLREGRSVAELARVHGVHRSWLYKLLARYRRDGAAGLAPRSRRPHRSPTALQSEVTEEIVRVRSDLVAQGLDAGALTIQWHLERRLGCAPSVSSIVRVLRRRGLVVPQPHKRPRLIVHSLRGGTAQSALADRCDALVPRR
jgi:transposase